MKTQLQAIRKQAGYKSAKAFADHIGMPVGTYTDYEQGRRMFTLEKAWEFADALDCTLDELAGRKAPNRASGDARMGSIADSYESMNDTGRARLAEQAEMMASSGMFAKSKDNKVSKSA